MGVVVGDKEKASASELWMLNDSDVFNVLKFIDDGIRRTKKGRSPMYRSCSLFVMII